MRIVSLLPSATEICFALGLGDELVGRTHECDYPPEAADIPVLTSDVGAIAGATSRQINDRVTASVHGGESIYRLDVAALAKADPDLILTQELCDVCAVSYRDVAEAVKLAGTDSEIVSLEPTSIEGIFNSISTVGAMAEAEDEAVGLIELLRERLAHIENRVLERRLAGLPPRRVVALEWIDPPFAAGHWVPEQVRRAGGWDLLGSNGQPAEQTTWESVRDVEPEMLLLIPCGFDAERSADEWDAGAATEPGWLDEIAAIHNGDIYAVDGSAYFSRPGPRVVDGIAILAEIFDPGEFADEVPDGAFFRVPARCLSVPRRHRCHHSFFTRPSTACGAAGLTPRARRDDLEGWAQLCSECVGQGTGQRVSALSACVMGSGPQRRKAPSSRGRRRASNEGVLRGPGAGVRRAVLGIMVSARSNRPSSWPILTRPPCGSTRCQSAARSSSSLPARGGGRHCLPRRASSGCTTSRMRSSSLPGSGYWPTDCGRTSTCATRGPSLTARSTRCSAVAG